MKWPEVKLSKVVERFISGGTPSTHSKEYWEGTIPWITGADFSDREIILGRRYINHDAVNNSATNIVPKNSIVMVTRTGVGKIGIAQEDMAISQDITGIILKDKVDVKYICFAISNKMSFLNSLQRGATIKGITRNDIANLFLPLPPISEQRRIVEMLDQADHLRKMRIEAYKKAERILPAIFIKMFGDPATNPKGWPVKMLGDPEVAQINPKFSNGIVPDDTEVSFIPMADVDRVWGKISSKQVKKYSEVKKGFTHFENNDVLFAKITPCMQNGKAAIARNLVNGLGFGSTEFHVLRPGSLAVSEWLYVLVRMKSFRKQAECSFTGTAGQQRVPTTFLARYEIGCPPIDLQQDFSKAVQRFHKTMDLANRGKDKIEDLFLILLHRAFSGDLTASWRQVHMKELLQEMESQAKALAL